MQGGIFFFFSIQKKKVWFHLHAPVGTDYPEVIFPTLSPSLHDGDAKKKKNSAAERRHAFPASEQP